MNSYKPWYEKISIWITIIAGICAIITFVYSISSTNDSNSDIIKNSNNEINTGDQSTIIIGDNNTINNESDNADNIKEFETEEFSVTVSYDPNTPQTSQSGVNILVNAETSFPAERVTISATSDDNKTKIMDMHGGKYEWHFTANFYIKGTYTVTVTAYDFEGKKTFDSFEYVY